MNKHLFTGLIVVAGVIAAGLIMNYGSDLPVLGDARKGFDA